MAKAGRIPAPSPSVSRRSDRPTPHGGDGLRRRTVGRIDRDQPRAPVAEPTPTCGGTEPAIEPEEPRGSGGGGSAGSSSFFWWYRLVWDAAGPRIWACMALLLALRLPGVFRIPILDCDETFNYWEPTHFLRYGRGLQTWEYSPEFGLRSYLYPLVHAAALWLLGGGQAVDRARLFFGLRLVFVLLGCLCEARFIRAAGRSFGPRLGRTLLFVMAPAAGQAHAQLAYLPQTFAQGLLLLSWTGWLEGRRHAAIVWMGAAALLGWPFAGMLGLTGLALDLGFRVLRRPRRLLGYLRTAGLAAAGMLGISVAVDWFFYRRWLVAVWNIARYNSAASGDAERGSAIYGTEPWDFYLRNLALNFNLVAPLALAGPPLLLLAMAGLYGRAPAGPGRQSGVRRAVQTFLGNPEGRRLAALACLACFPLYVWLAVFSAMPHKEERFMFVVYPLLGLAAALVLNAVSFAAPGAGLPGRRLRAALGVGLLAAAALVSLGRTLALGEYYGAPLRVYARLDAMARTPGSPLLGQVLEELVAQEARLLPAPAEPRPPLPERTSLAVCVGKEWYRSPGHIFLPDLCAVRAGEAPAELRADPLAFWLGGGGSNGDDAGSETTYLIRYGSCREAPGPWRSARSTTVQFELRFLRSGFGGQLPQPYITGPGQLRDLHRRLARLQDNGTTETDDAAPDFTFGDPGFAVTQSTSLWPPAMNDRNREEPSRYLEDASRCLAIVDLDLTFSRPGEEAEADAWRAKEVNGRSWRVEYAQRFLDAERTPTLERALWLPGEGWRRSWAQYQLLVRRGGHPQSIPA